MNTKQRLIFTLALINTILSSYVIAKPSETAAAVSKDSSLQLRMRAAVRTMMPGGSIPGLHLNWPVPNDPTNARGQEVKLTQTYAEFNDGASDKYHTGIDIAAPKGLPVFAASAGFIIKIQGNDTRTGCVTSGTGCEDHGFGNTVIVGHLVGSDWIVYTQYAHLDSIPTFWSEVCGPVDTGKKFRRTCRNVVPIDDSTKIGTVGGSGFGLPDKWPSHLHFEVKDAPYLGDKMTCDDGDGSKCPAGNKGANWGYTPSLTKPDSAGYHNPLLNLHGASELNPTLSLTLTTDSAFLVGPGGLAAARSDSGLSADGGTYRKVNDGTSGMNLLASRYAGATTANHPPMTSTPCKSGWYEIPGSFPDLDPEHAGATVNAIWVCGDNIDLLNPQQNPNLVVNKVSGPQGATFVISGSNFTPVRAVTQNITHPLGVSVYPTVSDLFGNTITFLQLVSETGTYDVWDIENATGSRSNNVAWTATLPVPPFALSIRTSNLASSSVTISGAINPKRSPGYAYFEWSTNPNLSYATLTGYQPVRPNNTTQKFSAPLGALSSGQTYYYCIDFLNSSNGELLTGAPILSFKTPLPTPTTEPTTAFTSSSVTLNGAVNPKGSRGYASFEWSLYPNLSYSTLTGDQRVTKDFTNQTFSAPLTGLSSGQTHYYRVNFVNSSTYIPEYGPILSFTVLVPIVETKPAAKIGRTAATLRGTITPKGSPGYAYFEWSTEPNLSYGTSTDYQEVLSTKPNQTFSAPLAELYRDQTYYYRIAFINNSNGEYIPGSQILSFTTK